MRFPDRHGEFTTFEQEFAEIADDLVYDLAHTFRDVPETMQIKVNQYVASLFVEGRDHPAKIVSDLSAALMWFFLAGREHAIRGYASPVGKSGGPCELGSELERCLRPTDDLDMDLDGDWDWDRDRDRDGDGDC